MLILGPVYERTVYGSHYALSGEVLYCPETAVGL